MRYSRFLAVLAFSVLFISTSFASGITGVFQGKIVQLPAPKSKVKWLYVQGRNGAIRRANIANAVIEYDDDYPRAKRRRQAAESLVPAVEVRVTAEQDEDKDGEWQATNVLILAPRRNPQKPNSKPSLSAPALARRTLVGTNDSKPK